MAVGTRTNLATQPDADTDANAKIGKTGANITTSATDANHTTGATPSHNKLAVATRHFITNSLTR